jgi:ArsR family transcriptional regulator
MPPSQLSSRETLASVAGRFSALGDPERLSLLALIASSGEVCNCHLEDITGFLPSKISRQLSLLHQAGCLQRRREGTWIHYSLTPASDSAHASWLYPLLDDLIHNDPDLAEKAARLRQCCPKQDSATENTLQSHLL